MSYEYPVERVKEMVRERPRLAAERDEALRDVARRIDQIGALTVEAASLRSQRDRLANDALMALAGHIPTPAEGYRESGAVFLRGDIERVVRERDKALEANEDYRDERNRERKHGDEIYRELTRALAQIKRLKPTAPIIKRLTAERDEALRGL